MMRTGDARVAAEEESAARPWAIPLSSPDQTAQDAPAESSAPLAEPVIPEAQAVFLSAAELALSIPVAAPVPESSIPQSMAAAIPVAAPVEPAMEAFCPACQSPAVIVQSYFAACGYFLPPDAILL